MTGINLRGFHRTRMARCAHASALLPASWGSTIQVQKACTRFDGISTFGSGQWVQLCREHQMNLQQKNASCVQLWCNIQGTRIVTHTHLFVQIPKKALLKWLWVVSCYDVVSHRNYSEYIYIYIWVICPNFFTGKFGQFRKPNSHLYLHGVRRLRAAEGSACNYTGTAIVLACASGDS